MKDTSETTKKSNLENNKKRDSRISDLEEQLAKERGRLLQIQEKFEKSKYEVLQLNKGINRKIDQVRKMSFDAKEIEEQAQKAKEIILKIHVNYDFNIVIINGSGEGKLEFFICFRNSF